MNPFRSFAALVFIIFLFTWMGLVVMPWIELGHLAPIKDEATNNITPFDKPNEAHAGEHVYASNGCAYCHTQQVRADTSGADLVRGWGSATNDDGKTFNRRTYPHDYIWDHQVFLGNNRTGADLTNVAQRYPDAGALYRYLYDPTAANTHSSMPAYRFLFVTHKIGGQPSAEALVLNGSDAPPAGYEILPTPEAKALVAYLLSLKNAYDLPENASPGAKVAPAKS